MAVPFDLKDLKKRVERVPMDLNGAVTTLWDTGLLGVFLCTDSENMMRAIESSLGVEGAEGYRLYTIDRQRSFTWSLFEYTYGGDPMALLSRYAGADMGDARLILHPKMFDGLLPRVDRSLPYGA